ncbi:MAG: hypothetical protein IPM74_02330 [Crocinitomicaceae bacterium]|nr:hypothetical protein [Crocinitomicaceae bacterium]
MLELYYNLDELRIIYKCSPIDQYEIIFPRPIGFRCLDEGDLCSYWSQEVFSGKNIYKIIEGGWTDLEELTGGFLTKRTRGCDEYFVCGENDCVNVLVDIGTEPIVKKLLTTKVKM